MITRVVTFIEREVRSAEDIAEELRDFLGGDSIRVSIDAIQQAMSREVYQSWILEVWSEFDDRTKTLSVSVKWRKMQDDVEERFGP